MRSLLFLVVLIAAAPAPARAERIFAELLAPTEGQVVRAPTGWLEVRGWAGAGVRGDHDVVLLIDRSLSAFRASGSDIDGDGHTAKTHGAKAPPDVALWTSDPGDTIVAAELHAAEGLIARLDADSTRMGLITFGGSARVRAPLGSSMAELQAAMDALRGERDERDTYLYGAINAAVKELTSEGSDPRRIRSIILLSDGIPTAPRPISSAIRFAEEASRRAALAGVRIYAFAIGVEAVEDRSVFERLIRANGGELALMERPADVVDYVPHLSLTRLDRVEIANLSHASGARALRVFPDGTFDAFLQLRPGENRIRLTVFGEGRGTRVIDRIVHFERTPGDSAAEREAIRRLLKTLQIRTLETELAERARRLRKRVRVRGLEVEIEDTER